MAAAGSLETPALLLRSGIGGPAVGAELRLHPASLVTGIYDEPQDPWYGPAMAGIMNEFAEVNDCFGYIIECVQHLPGLFTTVVPWLSGAQHKELTRKYRYRADWVFIVKDRGAGSVSLDENGEAAHWYPFTDELDRRHFREAAVTAIRMQEAAGAQQIFLAGQPFAPWNRGEDLEAFIETGEPGPDRAGWHSGFQCPSDVQRKAGQRPADIRRQTEWRAARHDRGLDCRRQWNALLLRGEPDGVGNGAGAPQRHEYARCPIIFDKRMPPRDADKGPSVAGIAI